MLEKDKPKQNIPIQLDMDDIAEALTAKEIILLQLRKANKILQQQLEQALEENEMLKKDIEKFQKLEEKQDGPV